ncbi:hypothetical protein E3N88_23098 [Mikania micrantha]|uniref:Uncharacterized protein n=1 Tax=Mikania micrantha TaxID=192012 RepID=A0A5N6NE23_9ASTR|nr:hypothetical protein E3N88_23098 [Mikania micrantha]
MFWVKVKEINCRDALIKAGAIAAVLYEVSNTLTKAAGTQAHADNDVKRPEFYDFNILPLDQGGVHQAIMQLPEGIPFIEEFTNHAPHFDLFDWLQHFFRKDVEGTEPAYKIGLSFRGSQQLGPTHKDPEGKLWFMLLGDDESDNGEDELLLWKADNSPDQVDSWLKVIHQEHSVMLQDLSTIHSTKLVLNLWLVGKKAAFQWVDVDQQVPSNSMVLTLAQPSSLSYLHPYTFELGHALHRDRGAQHLLHLGWKFRRKKGKCLRWGNRYGPAHKCPETRSVKWGRINDQLPNSHQNVANEREHLILVIANIHIRRSNKPANTSKLADGVLDELMKKFFKNYTKWCKFLEKKNKIRTYEEMSLKTNATQMFILEA